VVNTQERDMDSILMIKQAALLAGRQLLPGKRASRLMVAALAMAMTVAFAPGAQAAAPQQTPEGKTFYDSHFHLTNYVQQGISVDDFLAIMGDRVGRSTLFGIPLQQMWSYQNSGETAPTYYLHTDAPLYYYSFTDAVTARTYEKLSPEKQARFDPMIIGFNPADMYAVDHIRRVLTTFPGVFSGIGEFSIHKEFVSSKVAGEVASLTNPALDRIFDFCAESGLVAILHNDIDMPFAKAGGDPVYLSQIKDLLRRHPKATIIWAHTGLGRVVSPRPASASTGIAERSPRHLEVLEAMLADPALNHVYFDISWDEVAKYVTSSPDTLDRTAKLLNRYPDRFLFGSDTVAPKDAASYFRVFDLYQPLWDKLTPEASEKIRKGNYERVFDAARKRVRAWESANVVAN
jgi:predicted TIM-barrel fold metal-dependent hydrolase